VLVNDTAASSHLGGATVAVTAAAATQFTVSAPGGATAGVAFGYTVTARDPFGNTATGYAGTVHFTAATATPPCPRTAP